MGVVNSMSGYTCTYVSTAVDCVSVRMRLAMAVGLCVCVCVCVCVIYSGCMSVLLPVDCVGVYACTVAVYCCSRLSVGVYACTVAVYCCSRLCVGVRVSLAGYGRRTVCVCVGGCVMYSALPQKHNL